MDLRTAGIEVVGLKGAALAFFHYPDPFLRPMGDLDLLLQDPRALDSATVVLRAKGWIPLLDTPRHRVFARADENVPNPAREDPGNPIRLEIHTSFRLPVLGRVFDASEALRTSAETHALEGVDVAVAAGPALLDHLLFHAAEDFSGNGIRGIQAYDFRLLARRAGLLAPAFPAGRASPPLLFAADAIERLFPGAFDEEVLRAHAARTPAALRARAARLPPLRHTRPARGWSTTLFSLIDGIGARLRFLRRTLFPTLGEVKANVSPGATGIALLGAWVRTFVRRAVPGPRQRARRGTR